MNITPSLCTVAGNSHSRSIHNVRRKGSQQGGAVHDWRSEG